MLTLGIKRQIFDAGKGCTDLSRTTKTLRAEYVLPQNGFLSFLLRSTNIGTSVRASQARRVSLSLPVYPLPIA